MKKNKGVYFFKFLFSFVLVLVLILPTACDDGEDPDFTLTVLHNNDGESELIDGESGIARFATVVDNLRGDLPTAQAEEQGVIMLSSGDNFLAGPELNASIEDENNFFDAIGLNLIGYDAICIGNHEFDFGPDFLADFINAFNGTTPFLSSNLDFSGEPNLQSLVNSGDIAPNTVLTVNGRQIGVIGATTPQLPFVSTPGGVEVDDNVASIVQSQIDSFLNSGIQIIILISHLQSVNEDIELIQQLSGLDLVIAGGGDELLANDDDLLIPGDEEDIFGPYPIIQEDADGREIPVVTTSGQYRYVGRIILNFDEFGEVLFIDSDSGPVRVVGGDEPDAVEPDPALQAMVVDPVQASVDDLETNVIATSEVDLNGLRSDIRTIETNQGNLIADAILDQAVEEFTNLQVIDGMPVIGMANGGGIRNDSIIPAGDITELDTFSMLPFSNFITIVDNISPTQFKEILENAVSAVEDVAGRFPQIAGFSFTWDANGTPQTLDEDGNVVTTGTRVVEVTLDDSTMIVANGSVVMGAPTVKIATVDFLARGGDQYPFRDAPFTVLGKSYQQALRDFIVDVLGGTISAQDYPEGGEGRTTRLN